MRRGPRPHLRYAALVRDRWRCRYCGDTHPQMEADHVHPVAEGGQETLDNLVAACLPCNRAKGTRRRVPLPLDTSTLTEADVTRMFSAWQTQEGSQGASRVADVSEVTRMVLRLSCAPPWRVYVALCDLLDPVALLATLSTAGSVRAVDEWRTDGTAIWRAGTEGAPVAVAVSDSWWEGVREWTTAKKEESDGSSLVACRPAHDGLLAAGDVTGSGPFFVWYEGELVAVVPADGAWLD